MKRVLRPGFWRRGFVLITSAVIAIAATPARMTDCRDRQMTRWFALYAVVLAVFVLVACGGGRPTATPDEGLLSEQQAIERAVEQLKRPTPEIDRIEDPRNPVAWRTTLGEWNTRTGGGPSAEAADTPVWIVQVEGGWRTAGIVPPESRQTYRYGVTALDARTGSVVTRTHSNEPLVWAVATDAPSMSNPERMVRAQATPGRNDPIRLVRDPRTDAVVVGTVSQDLGDSRTCEPEAGGTIIRTWVVQVDEWIKGQTVANEVYVRVETQLLRADCRTGLPTGHPSLEVGEEVVLYLTRNYLGDAPGDEPGRIRYQYGLVGPYEGKWVVQDRSLRNDDPRYPRAEQDAWPWPEGLDFLRRAYR